MSIERHGISVGIERVSGETIIVFKAKGKLTHDDYQAMIPILKTTIKEIDSSALKMLVDISTLTGWELRAAWDDFKLGLELNSKIDKIAICGDKSWQELASKVGSWFVSGDIKSFEEHDPAIEWLVD
ncbi:STAS/SEC14 domain-containing protein [Vibrio chagasii]|uniref:STAS/SEC14 domain-containing protein n=1 Tax=Vibrio TaxID=662 RepID=UPI00076A6CE9|nr:MULTISPECIES: STAS/SEC14 domain-containing protein [Vibrio]MCG9563131.1 STAS/SEC14 domain-containing protein [Vibrio chagasii]MCG9569293.1 STAS/SEC14 domain-containing protein [Vibrio chagasii]MCG9673220.1 STAS/SEC14 domain-containing protein [Vibrio chagasii]NOI88609.1 STAS/SEC14 domain-containing protein [Vibrio sp. 99K-1]CAH6783411.1 STAS/SEC14 domain-containing protein [Vibrio chagasii]